MSLSNLLSDLPWWRLPGVPARLMKVTRFSHPEHERKQRTLAMTPPKRMGGMPFPRPRIDLGKEGQRLGEMEPGWWEDWILDPWVRRIEPLAFAYMNPDLRNRMQRYGITRLLDEHCQDRTWPEFAVTGSNVAAVSAGKAAWALLRWETSGAAWARVKYEHALNRTYWYLDRAFGERGVPHEGIMYGLFGLKAVAVLSHLQRLAGHAPVGVAFSKVFDRFPFYIICSAVGTGDFHHHGDSKTVDMDGAYLSWLYHGRGNQLAGQALALIGKPNARPDYYHRLYGTGDREPLPSPKVWPSIRHDPIVILDKGVNHLLYKHPQEQFMHVVDGGGGFPKHRLHLGVKPGSHSHWSDGAWRVKDDGYTNPVQNWRTYDPTVWSAPGDARLLEEARMNYQPVEENITAHPTVTLHTRRWRATIPLHK